MTKKQIETIRKRVKRGIKWLDKEKPNWIKLIFFNRLKMVGFKTCICGQVFGDFYNVSLSSKTIHSYGFDASALYEYDTLGEVWKEEIRKIKKKKHG